MTDEIPSEEIQAEFPSVSPAAESISDFAPQDWLLVIEALATTAGPPPGTAVRSPGMDGAITRPRAARAWELVSAIAAEVDLSPEEIAFQIDDDWRGPSSER